MKLVEITMISAHDMGDAQIRRGIKSALSTSLKLLLKIEPDVEVKIEASRSSTKSFYVLFIQVKDERRRALGYGMLEKSKLNKQEGYYVTEIGLLDDLRWNGIGLKFYRGLLDHGYTLFSGSHQTPDGRKTWQKLMKLTDVKVEIFDEDAQKVVTDVDPWSDDKYFLIAKKA